MRNVSRLPRPTLLALGLLLGSLSARAEEPAAVAMARARFEEGVAFFDAGRFEEARAAFLQAYALKPHPSILLNLAQSELRSGRYDEAAAHFTEYLGGVSGDAGAEEDLAEQGLAEAKRHVGELRITVDVDHAELLVDGRRIGSTPLTHAVFVTPGRHSVVARSGSHTAEQEVTAETAAVHAVDLVLLPIRTRITLRPLPLAVPSHDAVQGHDAVPSHDADPVPPEGRPSFLRWLFSSPVGVSGLVVTGAGVGLGIAGSIVASDRYGAAEDASDAIRATAEAEDLSGTICSNGTSSIPRYRAACADRQDLMNQGDTWRGIAIGGFVLAGAAAAGTVAYYLLDRPDERGPQARKLPTLVPVLTKSHQGISVVGTF